MTDNREEIDYWSTFSSDTKRDEIDVTIDPACADYSNDEGKAWALRELAKIERQENRNAIRD